MRAAIAKRLTEAKLTIPHYRISVDADFTALLGRRARLKSGAWPQAPPRAGAHRQRLR